MRLPLPKARALCEPVEMDADQEQQARSAASAAGIALPDACVPGVIDNLALLASHAALLDRFLTEHPDL